MTLLRTSPALAVGALLVLGSVSAQVTMLQAQTPAATNSTSAPPARQIGTIATLTAGSLTLTTDKGDKVSVALSGETKVVQLPAGSTDLKTAQPAAISDLDVGDRVLAIGAPGDAPASLTARRLVLMKSTDIAKRHETEQTGWQHGTGGIVSAVDVATNTVTIKTGARSITISTGPSTIIRRYAPNSARFEDATKSSLAELHPGDQLRVRGEHAEGGSITADEIVSGSFRHLSGVIQAINVTAGKLTVKDSRTQKPTVLAVTSGTAIHELPAEMATRFAARARASAAPPERSASPAGAPASAAGAEAPAAHGSGGDLSQVVSRLPAVPLSDLKIGETIMVVGGSGDAGSIAAITVLSGVEAILAATPGGGAEMTLSPWSMGGGGDAGAGSQ